MKTLLDYGVRLFLVCAIAILGIAGLYVTAKSDIDANEKAALDEALEKVLETLDGKDEIRVARKDGSVVVVHRVTTAEGVTLYAAEGAAQGYSSKVQVVLSALVNESGTLEIHKIRVKSQQETPGLGTQILDTKSTETLWSWLGSLASGDGGDAGPVEYEFLGKFEGKTMDHMKVTLNEEEQDTAILGISGATVSSDATVGAAIDALGKIREALDDLKKTPDEGDE